MYISGQTREHELPRAVMIAKCVMSILKEKVKVIVKATCGREDIIFRLIDDENRNKS